MKPGKYIWRNKDHDQIVEVEGVIGKGPDGRIYLRIKGSSTGIPAEQCCVIKNETKSIKPTNSRLF